MKNNRTQYKAAIIGLGNIALGYDEGIGKPPLTHVAALQQEGRVRLIAGCSPVSAERERFHALTGASVYDTPEVMLRAECPDLVSICSQTELHFEHAMLCIEAGAKMLWLEKPPVALIAQGETLQKTAREQGTTVLVGYQRRCAEPFVTLRKQLKQERQKELLAVSVHYSRKLLVNGCHALDTVSFMLGDPQLSLAGIFAGSDGETPSFLLSAGDIPLSFTGVAGAFHALEITLTFRGGQIEILSGGKNMLRRSVEADPRYPSSWLGLPAVSPVLALDDQNGMAESLDNLINAFEKGQQPISNLESAMGTQRIVEAVLKEVNR